MNNASKAVAINPSAIRPMGTGQTMEFRYVTPGDARSWLNEAGVTNFRKLSQKRVDALAAIFARGGWVMDGNPFKFNSLGLLVDGQHRAAAIAKSDQTVGAWLVRGVDIVSTIDTGASRTTFQALESRGEKYASLLASALRLLVLYSKHKDNFGTAISSGAYSVTMAECLDYLAHNPSLRESAKFCYPANVCSTTQVTFLHYATSRINKPLADKFVTNLISGADLGPDDPILRLRARMAAQTRSLTIGTATRLALLIIAWNSWLAGTELKLIKWTAVGPSAQPFPVLVLPPASDAVAA